jgi:FemAB-related protein (PEP-CTERM system-associated)
MHEASFKAVPAVRILRDDPEKAARWDAFVERCPDATFFHRVGWKRAIETGLGHDAHYLYAEEGGEITGVLPLVHLRSRLSGRGLISTAFCVYGGPAVASPDARRALTTAASDLAVVLDVDYLEYRSVRRVEQEAAAACGWQLKPGVYATFRKSLETDPERALLAIPRKQRAMVRKGAKLGLRAEIDAAPDRLHRVYAESVRNLGTPVFPKSWFAALKREFGSDCEILTVLEAGRPVSAVMSFYFRDEVLPYYGGGTGRARDVAGNDFMYWEVMRRAIERGCRMYDFGRSKYGTGAFDFKRYWGFEPSPLHYEYKVFRGDVPDVNPLNPKYRRAVALWQRLPLPVANLVGPLLARNFG